MKLVFKLVLGVLIFGALVPFALAFGLWLFLQICNVLAPTPS